MFAVAVVFPKAVSIFIVVVLNISLQPRVSPSYSQKGTKQTSTKPCHGSEVKKIIILIQLPNFVWRPENPQKNLLTWLANLLSWSDSFVLIEFCCIAEQTPTVPENKFKCNQFSQWCRIHLAKKNTICFTAKAIKFPPNDTFTVGGGGYNLLSQVVEVLTCPAVVPQGCCGGRSARLHLLIWIKSLRQPPVLCVELQRRSAADILCLAWRQHHPCVTRTGYRMAN